MLLSVAVIGLGCVAFSLVRSGVFAATTPSLGAAASYGILSTTYTNSAAGTTVNGDVGFTVAPTVEPDPVGGHTNYGSGGPYAAAGANQASALTALNNEGCTFSWPGAVDLFLDSAHGTPGTYTPGVYCSPGAFTQTGTITLNGPGTYVFRSAGAYTTTAGVSVLLAGGASACDVFWTPHATTLGAGTNFVGTLIDNDAVTAGAGTNILGRILAFNGPVTTATTTINLPACAPPPGTLHVVKQVVNNSGGSAAVSSFNLHVKLSGTDVAGSPAAGAGAPGTSYSLAAGTYVVSEDANAAYAQSFSGDCNSSGSVTLASGEDKTCTITNDDRPGSITVIKTVVNDNGRTKTIADFPLFVSGTPVTSGATNTFSAPGSYAITETADANYTQTFSGDCDVGGNLSLNLGDAQVCTVTNDDIGAPVIIPPVPPLIDVVKVPSPLTLPSGPGPVTYTYTLNNIGTVTATNITMTDDSCSPAAYVSGDTNANAQLEVSETWTYTCTTTVTATHTNTATATAIANGITATDIASATVVVGSSAVPPLIHVTNIPSVLTLIAGGQVTYTQTVTNPGTAPLSNVTVTNDTCALTYISGDTNSDSTLDPTEAWTYSCQLSLARTTTSTTAVTGEANGLLARDFAFATIVVSTAFPKFPNTGFGAKHERRWGAIAFASFIATLLFLSRSKKRTAKQN